MNRKIIKHTSGSTEKKCRSRSLSLAPFLDTKIFTFLKADSKKIDIGESEYCGKFNRYIVSLIRADLKSRNIL